MERAGGGGGGGGAAEAAVVVVVAAVTAEQEGLCVVTGGGAADVTTGVHAFPSLSAQSRSARAHRPMKPSPTSLQDGVRTHTHTHEHNAPPPVPQTLDQPRYRHGGTFVTKKVTANVAQVIAGIARDTRPD